MTPGAPQEPLVALEWPGDVRELPAGLESFWWVAALVVVAAVVVWRRAERRHAVEPAATAPAIPAPQALALLRALALPGAADDVAPFCVRLKALVRQHCSERYGVRGDVATSEELLARVPSAAQLEPCLAACDGVLFAAASPPPEQAARWRDLAVDYAAAAAGGAA
jgi:hypothetical protein